MDKEWVVNELQSIYRANKQDASTALRALELLGKTCNAFGDDKPLININLVDGNIEDRLNRILEIGGERLRGKLLGVSNIEEPERKPDLPCT